MSEYWKSVPRKFCDFCKCWITDNKPSVEFHERGKRHKENVEKRLREIRKKSVQESKDKETLDEEMARMEKAAMEAFKKDLKDNPALAAQYGVSIEPKPEQKAVSEKKLSSGDTEKSQKRKASEKKKEWYEAVTPEGYSYYWSTVTGESTWTTPEEYVSIVEQAEDEKSEGDDDSKEASKSAAGGSTESTESQRPPSEPMQDSRTGFGSWEVVREEQQPVLYDESSAPPDLDEIPLPSAASNDGAGEPPPCKPKFQEKTVTSLGPSKGGPVVFKKRKVAAGARNVRQRGGDE